MLLDIEKILYQKYLRQELAMLYMVQYNSKTVDPNLWVGEFLSQFTTITDHPDVLKIEKAPKESDYKIDSPGIKNLFKILNYKPIELKKIFIFIFDAQDLSIILSNKLLKIFEEMDLHFCLILMVPDKAPMLATVESRAVKLQISNRYKIVPTVPSQPSIDFSKITTPSELIQQLSMTDENAYSLEKKFIEQVIDSQLAQATATPHQFQKLAALLDTLAHYEKAFNFNNSKLSRLAPFFT
jgi:hypothetical protein